MNKIIKTSTSISIILVILAISSSSAFADKPSTMPSVSNKDKAFAQRTLHTKDRIERLSQKTGNIQKPIDKLQDRIDSLKQNGADVTIVQNLLDDMISKVNDAKTQYQNAADILAQVVAGNTNNKSLFASASGFVKAARQDIKAARVDASQIRKNLQQLRKNITPTLIPTPTPTVTQ